MILRLSQTDNLTWESTGYLPSLALKFLRDGLPSDNIVAMPQFTSTNSWNFFEKPMSNRVKAFDPVSDKCEDLTLRKKMTEATDRPFVTAVGHIGIWENWEGVQSDVPEADIRIPYELIFTSPKQFSSEMEFYDDNPEEPIMFYSQLMDGFSAN